MSSIANEMYANLGDTGGAVFNLNESQKYELILFFNYNCSSCFEFEKYFETYENNAPKVVSIKSVPTKVVDGWEWANKLHYYSKIIDPSKTRLEMYKTDFIQKHTVKSKEDLLIALTEISGIDRSGIETLVETQDVSMYEKSAENLAKKYQVIGTPTLILNVKNGGSYRIQPNGKLTYPQLIQIANGLVAYNEQKSSIK